MIVIPLSAEFLPLVSSGQKTSTVRRGVRKYPPGAAVLRAGGQEIPIRIERVRICNLDKLTEEDAIADGFESVKSLRAALGRFYRDLRPGEPMTIVEFQRS